MRENKSDVSNSNHNMFDEVDVPSLRFKEFNDQWKQVKITDIAEIVSGRTPSTINEKYWNGDINWFTAPELIGKKYVTDSEKKITENALKDYSIELTPSKSVLLSTRAKIGDRSINLEKTCTNQGIQSLIIKDNYSSEFVYYLLGKINKELNKKACGSTFIEISKKDLLSIKIKTPSLEEQEKVADFLSLIEKIINLYEKRFELLNEIKDLTMKKYFEKLSDYDKKRLGDVINIIPSRIRFPDLKGHKGKYKLYGSAGVKQYIDTYQSDEEYIALNIAGVGVGKVRLLEPYTSILNSMEYITPKRGIDLYFIYFYLKTLNYYKLVVGHTIPRIYNKDFSREKVHIPPLELQQEIGKTFMVLEKCIDLFGKEIEILQDYEKSIIQQVFA